MRTKTVLRHYCDHCAKGHFRKTEAQRHELGCTKNPERKCYLCEKDDLNIPELVEKLQTMCPADDEGPGRALQDDVVWLRGKCHSCPACMLSVLRQANVMAFEHFYYHGEAADWHSEFSYPE